MTNQSLQKQKIQDTAQQLQERGYRVVTEPSKLDLPFDLDNYVPDLVATKDQQGIVFTIKTSFKRISVDRLQNLAEQIASHNGWRFVLIALDDEGEDVLPLEAKDFPYWQDLESRLSKVDILIQSSLFEPAILFLWSILELLLRKKAVLENIPIERFPANHLLDHLYSRGEISMDQFDIFKDFLKLRNKIAHGIITPTDATGEMLILANNTTKSLIKEWQLEEPHESISLISMAVR
jgi:Holliday junction resolvase